MHRKAGNMSALAACTSPSGHALHTKGWGSILLVHIFCSHYQVLILVRVFHTRGAAKLTQQLVVHLSQPLQSPGEGAAFLQQHFFMSLLLFSAGVKADFSLHSQLNQKRFSEENVCNIGVILEQIPSCCNPLHCTIYKMCANRLRGKWSVAHMNM